MQKNCKHCKKLFMANHKSRIYCGIDCRLKSKKRYPHKRRELCVKCNEKKEFTQTKYCEACSKIAIKEQKERDRITSNRYSLKKYHKRKNNPEFREMRRKAMKKSLKKRYDNNPNHRMGVKLRNCLNQAIKRYLICGQFTKSIKYPIDYEEIIKFLKPTKDKVKNFQVDHIKPLCAFDLTDYEQIRLAFAPENHQWLTPKENIEKIKQDRIVSINYIRE